MTDADVHTQSQAERCWAKYHGLHATIVGEDGAMVVYGHHDDRRTVAALSQLFRDVLGERLTGTYGDAVDMLDRCWGRFMTACWDDGHPTHAPETCWRCAEIRQSEWWLAWGISITAETEGAFPITMWGP